MPHRAGRAATATMLVVALLLSGCAGWLLPEEDGPPSSNGDGIPEPRGDGDAPEGWRSIQIAAELEQPVFQGDIQHTGFYPSARVPDAVEEAWSISPWNQGEHSAVKGSPIRYGDLVYVANDNGTVMAVDLYGVIQWSIDVSDHNKGSHGTPLVTEEAVYIGTYDGYLHRLDRASGTPVWSKKLGGSVAASPLIWEGRLYISVETPRPSGIAYALEPATGETIWRDDDIGDHPHSSIAIDPERRIAVVGANDGILYAWHADNGTRLWTFTTDDEGAIKAPILVADGAAFFGSWDYYVYRVNLTTGKADWSTPTSDKVMGAPALDADRGVLYIGGHDDRFRAIDARTGRLLWHHTTSGSITGNAVVTQNAVLVGSYDRHLYAFDKDDGDVLWRFKVGGYPTAAPLVTQGPDGPLVIFADRACDHGPKGREMRNCDPEGPGRLWALRAAES